jgi:hypothetical protein
MWILDWLPFWVFHLAVLSGVLGLIASQFFDFIPFVRTYAVPLKVVAIIVLVFGVYMEGGITNQEKWEAKVAEAKIEVAQKETAAAETTIQVVTKYVKQIQVVKETGDVIIKEIPTYITKVDDAKCIVPNGFVMLHDSASRNEIPDTSRIADEGASKVKISGVAETVIDNYTTYYQVSEQLKSLQQWVKEQQNNYNK